ncbi:hypothetical protein LARV_03663 [Longilinea arvoryzae]|uniref:Membrane proteins related to metalloendopeptidases n=1 Tax=Longilinea arvoryzae TaxID=360412 RepID=A0A0S7BJC9_9CHLR|nr:hypothetical protein [Longilinea arvoryzae]GAP15869.1 hypothetical protein LARV_03663 [Longilinea arvoryzae]
MRNHRIYLALVLVWLLPALACNLPSRARMLARETPADLEIVTQAPAATASTDVALVSPLGTELAQQGEIFPDSEVVNSPAALGFDVASVVASAGGYLSTYTETVDDETMSGAQIVQRIADETSTNPRLLLGLLEFRSGWVFGQPRADSEPEYPLGFENPAIQGLDAELRLAVRYLSQGYYGERAGQLSQLVFPDGVSIDLPANANPGTAALYALFSRLLPFVDWQAAITGPDGFIRFYTARFGDPWQRAVEVLSPAGLTQPQLDLPFAAGETWAFTGGPHIDWGVGSPLGAIDLAPIAGTGCKPAPQQALAAASGVVARSERGALALDLDGDGNEQTGWVLIYMHLANRAPVGTRVAPGDPLGNPSCEGGNASGAHVHLARKYNGEWLGLDRIPFVLSGWQVEAGEKPYQGRLVRGNQLATASPSGMQGSSVFR